MRLYGVCRVQGETLARYRECSPCTLHTPYRRMYNWLASFHCTTWRWPTFVAETCSCALHIVK